MNSLRMSVIYLKWLILVTLLFVTLILIGLFFIPAFSRILIQQASLHYLKHRLEIHSYHVSPIRLFLAGTFDDNSSIRVLALDYLRKDRIVRIESNTTLRFFAPLLQNNLPVLAFDANVTLNGPKAEASAQLLDGTLQAAIDLDSMKYRFAFDRLNIDRYVNDNRLTRLVSGSISADGQGIAKAPYTVNAKLKSNNISLLDPLIAYTGLQGIPAPVDLNLTADARLDDVHVFNGSLHADSIPFTFTAKEIDYNPANGAYAFSLDLMNHTIETIPVRHTTLLGFGHYRSEGVDGNYTINADDYLLRLRDLRYRFEPAHVDTALTLSSVYPEPYNLSGDNALSGTLAWAGDVLDIDLLTNGMTEPLHLHHANRKIDVISNNIPIHTVASIFNRPGIASGNARIELTADIAPAYPSLMLKAATDDLTFDRGVTTALDLSAPISVSLAVRNSDAHYHAQMTGIAKGTGSTSARFDYHADTRKASIQGTLKDLKLPPYFTPHVAFHADADLTDKKISNLSVATPFESLDVAPFTIKENFDLPFRYRLTHPERFIPDANASESLAGIGRLSRRNGNTGLEMDVDALGKLYAYHKEGSGTLYGEQILIKKAFSVLGQPAPVFGTVTLDGRFDAQHARLSITSPLLTPSSDLNATLRPFPLDAVVELKREKQRTNAVVRLKTAEDSVIVNNIDLDAVQQEISGQYRVDLRDVNRSVLILPADQLGDRLSAVGTFKLAPAMQQLSLRSDSVRLSPDVHRMFDKNATDRMPLALDITATKTKETVSVRAKAVTEPITVSNLSLLYHPDNALLQLDTALLTDRYPGNAKIRFQGYVQANSLQDGVLDVHTEAFEIRASSVHADPVKKDYGGDATVTLARQDKSPERAVTLYATLHTLPAFEARLHTEAFEGNISTLMNEDLLIVHATDVNLPRLLHFAGKDTPLKHGRISVDAILDAPPLLEQNLSNMSGGIDVHLQDLLVDGISIDRYLDTLQDTQDLSLFQGSLTKLPVIRSIKDLPEDLSKKKVLQTEVPIARAAVSLSQGVLVCQDCAAATKKHRLAFAGDIDLTTQRFDKFYVALLKPSGCPYYMQEVKGTLTDPKLNLAGSGIRVIGGSVVSLASNVTDAANWLTGLLQNVTTTTGKVVSMVPIAGRATDVTLNSISGTLHNTTTAITECTPFYIGTVPPPKP